MPQVCVHVCVVGEEQKGSAVWGRQPVGKAAQQEVAEVSVERQVSRRAWHAMLEFCSTGIQWNITQP